MTTAQRLGRVARWGGLALLGLAVALAVAGWAVRWRAGVSAVDRAERLLVPGKVTVDLGSGRHGIWVEDGRGLDFYDVTIDGPAGEVPYADYGFFGSSATLEIDGTTYDMDGHFEVDTGGAHTVRFDRREGERFEIPSAQVAVGPNDDFAFPVPTFIAWLAAGLFLVFGLALGSLGVLAGLVGKRSAGAATSGPPGAVPPVPPPPGAPGGSGAPPPTAPPPGPTPRQPF